VQLQCVKLQLYFGLTSKKEKRLGYRIPLRKERYFMESERRNREKINTIDKDISVPLRTQTGTIYEPNL
jgi:hypothetical protein